MSPPDDAAQVRHDLKNVLTALSAGCRLIDANVGKGDAGDAEIRSFLEEMLREIAKGRALIDRLRPEEPRTSG